jgi:hypothetical protein
MWSSLAATNGFVSANGLLEMLSKTMTPAQIAAAQRLAQEWKAEHPKP